MERKSSGVLVGDRGGKDNLHNWGRRLINI
jgi:hypothetical protein